MSRVLTTVRRSFPSVLSLRLCLGLCVLAWLVVTTSADVSTAPPDPESAPQAGQVVAEQRSSDNVWQFSSDRPALMADSRASRIRGRYAVVSFNRQAFAARLATVARDTNPAAAGVLFTMPFPDGTFERFIVKDSPILAPELQGAFPEFRTFSGQGVDDPTATTRFGWTDAGFHAIVLSNVRGTVYIDTLTPGDTTTHVVYRKGELQKPEGETWRCFVEGEHVEAYHLTENRTENIFPIENGGTLRTYRLALAATAEYTAAAGGIPGAVARITATMNRVNGIYERDLAVRMTVATGPAGGDATALIFTDAATDGYTNNDGFAMLDENQAKLDAVIGTAGYDLGHVFSTGGGGVAQLRSPCNATGKGRGVTGSSNPTGDAFDVDYVAHEIGHQFGGNHTFNGKTSSCSSTSHRPAHAYEVGSGVTIQAYAGICGVENLQLSSIDRFHAESLDEMTAFITNASTGDSCGTDTATGNTAPTVTALPTRTIPAQTPFALTASATDANGDSLTYAWDQFDQGTEAGTVGVAGASDGAQTAGPLFRPYSQTTSPTRRFPSEHYILNNANAPPATYTGTAFAGGPSCGGGTCLTGEVLPTVTRTMNFMVVVRDNRSGGGGIATQTQTVNVVNTGAPFRVTAPNAAVSIVGNTQTTVTWDVAGTTGNGINAANVMILLSTDGLQTFTTLAASTPNTGSANVTIPNSPTTTARIVVQAVDNVFFDVSDANFTIAAGESTVPGTPTSVVATAGNAQVSVAFTAPTSNGGSAITGYTVTASPGGATVAGTASPIVVTGLTNGTAYTFTVTATNAVGTGPASAASSAVTPMVSATVPGAPTAVVGTPGNARVSVAFTAPASTGGSAITGYTVTASPGGATATGTASPIVVTGLTNGTAYTFTVTATNAVGTGAASSASASVTPVAPSIAGSPATLRFGATKNGAGGDLVAVTAAQTVTVSFTGSPTPTWTASSNQTWAVVTGGTGTGAGSFTVGITNPGNVIAGATSLSATITLSATNAGTTVAIPVTLTVTQQTGTTAAPIGQVDTPAQSATDVVGAIGVTGWALDDVGVASVKIYRPCLGIDNPDSCQTILGQSVVFVGDAAFLPGARPDVEGAFPAYPNGNAAGWGMQILTNMLPHIPNGLLYGGQGALTLYVYATDLEGNVRLLGRSSDPTSPEYTTPTFITMGNDTIAKPFGTIDTPALGGTISGTIANFGWVLTPDSNTTAGDPGDILMATNGSGMVVYIDGVATATVAYNQCRGTVGNPPAAGVFCNDDIANIFGNTTPQPSLTTRTANPTRFRNLDATRSAIGAFVLDTTTLTNGRHEIAWGVADSAARGEGIGSRFFTVLNAGGDQRTEAQLRDAPAEILGSAITLDAHTRGTTGVYGRTGYALDHAWKPMVASDSGTYSVRLPESGRLELWLGEPVDAGYLVANGTLRPLPVGSTLSGSYFAWMPPVGYVGPYTLAFVRGTERIDVTVTVAPVTPTPEGTAEVRMHLDPVQVEGPVLSERSLRVEGWAFDPKASIGAGIGAVHVWARRIDAGGFQAGAVAAWMPVFLGAATLDVPRPDVARAHPTAPGHSGYQLTATLGAGTWELTAYVWNDRTARWEDARSVSVIVR